MAGIVHIPWYISIFRGERFAAAVEEIAPLALRYGATRYEVHQSREDKYRFLQMAEFESKSDFERYWYGPEFNAWRAKYHSWFHLMVVYEWFEIVGSGSIETAPASEQVTTSSV